MPAHAVELVVCGADLANLSEEDEPQILRHGNAERVLVPREGRVLATLALRKKRDGGPVLDCAPYLDPFAVKEASHPRPRLRDSAHPERVFF